MDKVTAINFSQQITIHGLRKQALFHKILKHYLSKGEVLYMAYVDIRDLKIDEEFKDLLPVLTPEDYNMLEQSLMKNGFDKKFGKIKVWFPKGNVGNGYIVDGHNRFKICKKHNIKLENGDFEQVKFDSRDNVKKWIFENQLARRNLSIVDKYEIVEKYSVTLKVAAKKNQSDGGKGLINITRINVMTEKAKMMGISEGSYYKLDKIMKSNNDDINRNIGKLNKEKEQIIKKLDSIYEILDIKNPANY